MTRIAALITLCLAVACSQWRPPRPSPLVGWTPAPSSREGVEEHVRGSALLQILEPIESTPAEFVRRFADAEGAAMYVTLEIGIEVWSDAVEVGPVRAHGAVSWVDIAFTADAVTRRARVAWFGAADGTHVFRLIAPTTDWTARDLSPFQEYVRAEALAARLED